MHSHGLTLRRHQKVQLLSLVMLRLGRNPPKIQACIVKARSQDVKTIGISISTTTISNTINRNSTTRHHQLKCPSTVQDPSGLSR